MMAASTGGLDEGPGDAAAEAPEDDSMQHPILVGLNGGSDAPEAATQAAWDLVADAFVEALSVPELPAGEKARLTRCYRNAAAKCDRQPVALLPPLRAPARRPQRDLQTG